MSSLIELLRRFRRPAVALAVLFAVLTAAGYLFSPQLIRPLERLLGGAKLYQTAVAEALWARILTGVFLAAAVCFFVLLGILAAHFGRGRVWAVFGALFLFAVGVFFALTVLLPSAVSLLLGLLPYETRLSVSGYVCFCCTMLCVTGILFEEPLVVYVLWHAGLLRVKSLRSCRGRVYLVMLILLAVLTPSGDAVTLLLSMLPFMALYEAALLWLGWLERRAKKA